MEPLVFDFTVDESFGNLQTVFAKLRPAWCLENVAKKEFTAGITNKITGFYLKTDAQWEDMLLVRRYGYNTELIIDRKSEQNNIKLIHAMGLGAPLHAVLNNALVYGFIQGETTDTQSIRFPEVRELVAKEMAKLHSADLSKHPEVPSTEPMIFKKIYSFLSNIPAKLSNPAKQKAWEDFGVTMDEVHTEILGMQKLLKEKFPTSPCGFTHNDLLLENVVYNPEKSSVSFIDFEYGGYSYLYFDIGNHFTEHAGVGVEDHNLYPSDDYQKEWLTLYLSEYHRVNAISDVPITDDLLNNVIAQVKLFSLCSYLFWGVWAFFQAENSAVEFDYVGFAKSRLGAFYDKKEKFIASILS